MKLSKKGKDIILIFITVIFAVAVFLVAGLIARSSRNDFNVDMPDTSTSVESTAGEPESTTDQPETSNSKSIKYEFKNSSLKFESSSVTDEQYGDNYYLVLNFEYTNKTDSYLTFNSDIVVKAFQNDKELTSPLASYGINNYNNRTTEQPLSSGETVIVQQAFITDDFKDEVTVKLYSKGSDTPEYQFKLVPKK